MGSATSASPKPAGGATAHVLAGPSNRRNWDRRGGSRFVLRERRSGYERRACDHRNPLLVPRIVYTWLHSVPWFLPVLLTAANVLSLADILMTMRLLEAGAWEVNPLMRALLGFDVHVAAAAKASLVAAATLLIWRYRGHRKILPLALLLTGVFAGVVLYQGLLMLAA